MAPTIKLAEYLLIRLKQLGVDSIHGVPGDYNLAFLDYIEPQGIHWVGNCNELNAGYASDAYARIKGLGALITTFGVGELSASNAIAGAYAELAPVVHIVGTPSRHLQQNRALVHHTLNDGDFRRFAQMASHITIAQASLSDPCTCPQLIDSTIQQCLVHSRPVYIELPADMVATQVDATNLQTKITLPALVQANDEAAALELVLQKLYAAERPMILVDGESKAYGILDELHELIGLTQWPTWVTVFSKSTIDESLPNFNGIWGGSFARKEDQDYVQSTDLILCFGPHFSNTNTYQSTSIPDPSKTILFKANTVEKQSTIFRDLPAKQFLKTLLTKLESSKIKRPAGLTATANGVKSEPTSPPADGDITQLHFYRKFNNYLKPGDIILAETGTAGHGCREFKLPRDTFLFKPSTWLSIGYMLPATQGAALAQRELHRAGKWNHPPRAVLLIGDGSFQMTAQELSIIIQEKLNVLLILINNDGYTIERCLHGYKQHYNNIAHWNYLKAPALFGASETKGSGYHYTTAQARTWAELDEALQDGSEDDEPTLRMIEVFMDKEDAPGMLKFLLDQQRNAVASK